MNGWTPQMVLSLPTAWHEALVAMLQNDDKPTSGKTGFSMNEGYVDR
jgi:hypothetical protein